MNEEHVTESVAPDVTSLPAALERIAPGTTLAARYQIRRHLGSGGYSHVYAAEDRTLGREVALKVLRADRLSDSTLKRMRREVVVAQKTRSPNLLRIFDFARHDEYAFLTMELVSGSTLREKIANGPFEIDEVLRIAMDVLEALDELHLSGIVHRDIKPGNILVDEKGAVRLADFGLVREIDSDESRATASDAVIGTLRYVSPEQALGRDVDARSDLFSLGIVLFEMLTGQSPFEESSTLGTLLAHVSRKAPDVRRLRPDTPRWLAGIVARLLERRVDDRYPTARAVIEDFDMHRSRIAPARLRRRVASVALVAAIAAGAIVSLQPKPRLDDILIEAGHPARGVDRKGETLWTRDDLIDRENTAFVRTREGTRIATFLSKPRSGPVLGIPRELSFLDPETGELTSTATLPKPWFNYENLPMNFVLGGTFAADVDSDGLDELFVNWMHFPYYPSLAVYHSPATGRSQFLFAATGHHRAGWVADVDGDGRKEVILTGINNRFGWHTAVAAVRVPDPEDEPIGQAGASGIPSTPDTDMFSNEKVNAERLVFYALLPEGTVAFESVEIDDPARRIRLQLSDGRPFSVTFDGFLEQDVSKLDPDERNELRRQAYQALRQSKVDAALSRHDEALKLAERASSLAERAADSQLTSWASLVTAGRLVESGLVREATERYDELASSPLAVRSVSWDAARHLHVEGHLDEAIRWYVRGLAATAAVNSGRSRYQYMEGTALALAEADRLDDLLARTSGWREAFGADEFVLHFQAFANWIAGRPVSWTQSTRADQGPGLQRYWEYEFRLAAGERAESLLAELEGERVPLDVPEACLASLRSELLAAIGREEDAVQEADAAWSSVISAPRDDLVTRAHRRKIGERYARLEAARGNRARASEVRAALEP